MVNPLKRCATRCLPKRHTDETIVQDISLASAAFRLRREAESNAPPSAHDDHERRRVHEVCRRVIALLPRLKDPNTACSILARCFKLPRYWTALRYCTAASISNEDLRSELGVPVSLKAITAASGIGAVVARKIINALPQERFPWISAARAPTVTEFAAALGTTTTLIVKQRRETLRRSRERDGLEGAFAGHLAGCGFTQLRSPKGGIKFPTDAPAYGHYYRNCVVGDDEADLVVGLPWGQMLVLECKGSNTELNSRKRLYKELTGAALHWKQWFGRQVIPAVAIQGVFDFATVKLAQEDLYIFWQHRPADLIQFLEACAIAPKGNVWPVMSGRPPLPVITRAKTRDVLTDRQVTFSF